MVDMSYSIPMTFLSAENKADAMLKADDFVKKLVEPGPSAEYIKTNLIYFKRILGPGGKDELDTQIAKHLDAWLNKLFTVRCTFWPQHKLLGITGMNWPEECLELAQGKVYFQNSTDQNYEYSVWPAEIPFYQDCIMEIRTLSDLEIIRRRISDDGEIPEEDMPDAIEYARRTLLYRSIYDKLDLEHWLYDYSAGTGYEQFAMCGLYASDQEHDFYNKTRIWLMRGGAE